VIKNVDRFFAVLLLVFGAMHSIGSVAAYAFLTPELVWAISASGLSMLVAVLNFIRAGRPEDRTLAWVCFSGCIVWAILALWFGVSIGNLADPRADLHALAAGVLAVFSFRTAMGREAVRLAALL
jgi:hypothetical protein